MVSRAVAGVDQWIVQAKAVLEEQRERSLSPSSTPVWDAGEVERAITLEEFAESLQGVLKALCERPGRWILIAEDAGRPSRFWQALCYEDGSLVTEVVSNYYLKGEDCWSNRQEAELARFGWERPEPPRRPNWIHVEYTTSPAVAEVATQAAQSLHQVFGVRHDGALVVRLFSSPNRGGTPASAQHAT